MQCALFDAHYFRTIKEKDCLHHESLDQLTNLNISFVIALIL